MAAPQDEPASQTDGQDRRAFPRHTVDCMVAVAPIAGSGQIPGRIADLSLGGCRVETNQQFLPALMTRVEVQFQLRGIAFRLVGVIAGCRPGKSFAIRFLDMTSRRREELVEVIAEIAQINALAEAEAEPEPAHVTPADSAATAAPQPASAPPKEFPTPPAELNYPQTGNGDAPETPPLATPVPSQQSQAPALSTAAPVQPDRRSHGRHTVDTRARLLLVKTNIAMAGRIVNLSLGGCRVRTDERFNVGIFVRIEAEFYLHGLPFRVGGVSQAILDKNTIGMRFLDLSDRRRKQLTELIEEIAQVAVEEAERKTATAPEESAGDASVAG